MKYQPIDKGRMYSCLLAISWITILACTILKLFGSTAFEMPEFTYNINIWIRRIINFALYYINSLLFFIILVKKKPKLKDSLFVLGLSIPPFLCFFFIDYPIILASRYILEFVIYLVMGFVYIKDKWYKIFFEVITISCIFLVYQILTVLYRNIGFGLSVDNFIAEKILLIDFYILLILTALRAIKKGGYIHGWRWRRILVVLSKRRFSKENVRKDQEHVQGQEVEFGFKLFIIMLSVFQIVLVGTICYFVNHTAIEYIIISLSFFFLRKVFGKSYHSESVLSCTTLAILVFVSATRLTLPVSVSILCSVLIGCLVAYMMFVMYHFIKYTTAQGITIMRGMSKEAMKEICVANNLSDIEEGILTDFYCNRWKIPKIAMKYGYSVDSINKKKAEILKKIKM